MPVFCLVAGCSGTGLRFGISAGVDGMIAVRGRAAGDAAGTTGGAGILGYQVLIVDGGGVVAQVQNAMQGGP